MSMFATLTHGAKAGRSGNVGESIIEAIFHAFNVPAVNDNPSYHQTQIIPRTDSLLIRQHVLVTDRKIDFLYKNFKTGLDLCIESKNQKTRGTTDEKLSYTIDMLEQSGYPAFWLILSGGRFSYNVVRAVDKKIRNLKQIKGRLIHNEGPFLQHAIERLVDHGEI